MITDIVIAIGSSWTWRKESASSIFIGKSKKDQSLPQLTMMQVGLYHSQHWQSWFRMKAASGKRVEFKDYHGQQWYKSEFSIFKNVEVSIG